MKGLVKLRLLVRTEFPSPQTSRIFIHVHLMMVFVFRITILFHSSCTDDGKLKAESDSGEFWVLFGGFAPIGKKVITEDDAVSEKTSPQLYR